MNNNIKSLVYLSSFILAAGIYHVSMSNITETETKIATQVTQTDIISNVYLEPIGE